MLVSACVLPHPPLLVPEVASGAAPELHDLRTACDDAIDLVLSAWPDVLVVVGDGPADREFPHGAVGSMRGFGVDVRAVLGRGGAPAPGSAPESEPVLPLSLTIGAWLLARAPWPGPVAGRAVPPDRGSAECAAVGAGIADGDARVGLIAMGDGSARRSLRAPGYLDQRAEPFDDSVRAAFEAADWPALLALDPALATELLVAGRAAWQVLAGAALAGGTWDGVLLHSADPYGVAYHVAGWTRRD